MEYSFWADESGLHLALFNRGSHRKCVVNGSSIARAEIDETANKICALLDQQKIRGSQLKTIVVRSNQAGETVAALFVKDQSFPDIAALGQICQGVTVCFSNPKSPASVLTRELYTYGDIRLSDQVLGTPMQYDVHSFFQVNLPIFETVLTDIKKALSGMHSTDFYSGVGTIGIPVGSAILVESDQHNVDMATLNLAGRKTKMIHASAETALEYVPRDGALILDPPRAGLHARLVDAILEAKPPLIVYLSCNPSTQARDLALLQGAYRIKSLTGYNFFPRTPHIESLAILEKL
jgi:23S rRNA (uracil1939-C5)-methyltransferase